MAEEQKEPQGEAPQAQQVTKEPQQVTQVMKEPQGVTTKNLKKVETGKRLAVHNHKKREEQRKGQAKLEKTTSGVNQYYGIGAVKALGLIGGPFIGAGKALHPEKSRCQLPNNHAPRRNCRTTSLRWIKSLL